jgi:fimbrial chaperone protein
MNPPSEQTYRLFLEELPVIKPGGATLKFALTMGVPIFIEPVKEIKKSSIERLSFSKGILNVRIKNNGNRHFIVGEITASGLDGRDREIFKTSGKGWYVLAGAEKTFQVNIPEADCQKASKLSVSVEVEQNLLKGNLDLDKRQCVPDKKDENKPSDRPEK